MKTYDADIDFQMLHNTRVYNRPEALAYQAAVKLAVRCGSGCSEEMID